MSGKVEIVSVFFILSARFIKMPSVLHAAYLDKARKRAPAIIFLDEIDACGGKRANTTIQPYARQTINQLLQEMDG